MLEQAMARFQDVAKLSGIGLGRYILRLFPNSMYQGMPSLCLRRIRTLRPAQLIPRTLWLGSKRSSTLRPMRPMRLSKTCWRKWQGCSPDAIFTSAATRCPITPGTETGKSSVS
jgi:hypothetical protein